MSAPVLLAVSHGTSSEAGRRAVAALVDAVREASGARVESAFVDVQQPDVPAALAAIGDRSVVVVPLLLSAGYHVNVDLVRELEAFPRARLARALGPDPRLASVLVRRLGEAGRAPGDRIVLAAAGSSDRSAVADCRAVAGLAATELGLAVRLGFLSAARPSVARAVANARAVHPLARVAVASYLLAPGYFHDLAVAAGGELTSAPLLGDGPVPDELVDVVLDRYAEVALSLAA
ncbi:sirohydrochlorin chelatase [Agromyces archimandritae]|uniref:Cobalamin biosynthesis protein CbiX n=1 Tax=Agromyces archimandritae TaxID=2781962 RepID=A0A975FM77_9MICO|nr:CbiX/SirB N-terminal domain-containing protein [Agromyces archimandritae]QTX04484.1 cobalamin biosynthesis protein CbiX [Agromyces archimandritae]